MSTINGVDDIDYSLSVTLDEEIAVAQAILRALTTPRGQLLGCPTYGYDVRALVGSAIPADVAEARITEQCLADERVLNADVQVTLVNKRISIAITLELSDGPFAFKLNVNTLTVEALTANNTVFWSNAA